MISQDLRQAIEQIAQVLPDLSVDAILGEMGFQEAFYLLSRVQASG